MKRLCIKCKKEPAVIEPSREGHPIFRGVCASCRRKIESGDLQTVHEILDSLHAPILLLDSRQRVRAANKQARDILNRPLLDIENHLIGDAMECLNARLPGGCGQTVHCQACALKKALDRTMEGHDAITVPAYHDFYQEDGSVTRRYFSITTEKLDDFILLRLDNVQLAGIDKKNRPAPYELGSS